ncbi:hypothetical protein BGZ52_012583, partial [Haplosporangium bisporale]
AGSSPNQPSPHNRPIVAAATHLRHGNKDAANHVLRRHQAIHAAPIKSLAVKRNILHGTATQGVRHAALSRRSGRISKSIPKKGKLSWSPFKIRAAKAAAYEQMLAKQNEMEIVDSDEFMTNASTSLSTNGIFSTTSILTEDIEMPSAASTPVLAPMKLSVQAGGVHATSTIVAGPSTTSVSQVATSSVLASQVVAPIPMQAPPQTTVTAPSVGLGASVNGTNSLP